MVDHGKCYAAHSSSKHDRDRGVRRRELHRVRKQVGQHLQHAIRVRIDFHLARIVQQLHSSRLGHRLHIANRLLHNIRELNRPERQRLASALDPLQIENVIDQPNQPVRIRQRNAQQVRRLVVYLTEDSRRQQPQCSTNRCERRAQFVAHSRNELILQPVQRIALAYIPEAQYRPGKASLLQNRRQRIFGSKRASVTMKNIVFT